MIFHSHSEEETKQLGRKMAKTVTADTICMFGEMGCGKTEFVKGFLEGLGYNGDVTSPTFALCHTYDAEKTVYHYDLYRLSGYDDLYSIGFFDRPEGTVSLIEWSENAEDYLPEDALRIYFTYGDGPEDRILRWEENE
ncbi:MAG: tRNA (adenosine(37)-N6)-threonylcarbamoyltransferase complex ATPase subunit type 1 TsaE [Clostridia bacterium]|nr:tRNA (adenosine(37)-N6)-threonylcarbamoyltransferase complex ATPase subunit type 1 TsaE [Clostridia bacterium]